MGAHSVGMLKSVTMYVHFAYYLILAPALLLAITCHECAHAAVARLCGDPTAQRMGRLTLNPLAHLDPLGTLMIFLVGFGWGKPVPVDVSRLRHPRADALVSAAGPLTNLLLAWLASRLLRLTAPPEGAGHSLSSLLLIVLVELNLGLCFFNLIPLFPLDGSHVFEHLLPGSVAGPVAVFNRRYGGLILLGLVLAGRFTRFDLFSTVLAPPIRFFHTLWLGH